MHMSLSENDAGIMRRVHAAQMVPTALFATCACGWEADTMGRVRRILPAARTHRMFIRGTFLITCDLPAPKALETLADSRTLHLSTVTPVTARAEMNWERGIDDLAQAAYILLDPQPGETFRVCCRRRGGHDFGSPDIERRVGEVFYERDGLPVDLEEPEQIVSVEILQHIVYMGVNHVDRLLDKAILQKRKYPPGRRPVNRAEWKLREALREFNISITTNTRALDLGAAPGGWTRVLAEHGAEVVAVDPGDLDARVEGLENVRHLPVHAEEFLKEYTGPPFDVICNDMNIDPEDSARLMVDFACFLRQPGGVGVMTVKFVTVNRERHVDRVKEILGRAYGGFQVQTMPHNARETTLLMKAREK